MEDKLFNKLIADLKKDCPSEVSVSSKELTPNQVSVLCNALHDSCVEELDLSYNKIDNRSVVAVMELLKNNSNLTFLHLAGSRINEQKIHILSCVVKDNITLSKLDLSHAGMRQAEISTLATALVHNSGILSLNLSYNYLCENAIFGILADVLSLKDNLQELFLDVCIKCYSPRYTEGTEKFFSEVIKHPNLWYLSMEGNNITLEQLTNFCKKLEHSVNLRVLDMTKINTTEKIDEECNKTKEKYLDNATKAYLMEILGSSDTLIEVIGLEQDVQEKSKKEKECDFPGLFINNMRSLYNDLSGLSLDTAYSIQKLDNIRIIDRYFDTQIEINNFLYRHWIQSAFISKTYDDSKSSLRLCGDVVQLVGEFIGEKVIRKIAIQTRNSLISKYHSYESMADEAEECSMLGGMFDSSL